MPIYKYLCRNITCNHTFESSESIKDERKKQCPKCNTDQLAVIIQPTRSVFKGNGWTFTRQS